VRSILVTGGTGSLGRALIHRLLTDNLADRVVSLSRDEVKAGDLANAYPGDPRLRVFLGDVRERERLEKALSGVEVVVHAAALKRVQQSVYSPAELIKTNVIGTMNVVDAATECGVGKVVFVSSDKSVEATNLYGSTKHTAETYAIQANSYAYPQGTRIAAVRYGNVLASRGSVVPIWMDCVRRKEPFLITDPEMTRFWLTLEDAVDLVLLALERMAGGEVFVPILPSVKLLTLAESIGGPDFTYQRTGLRPGGEKRHELLLNQEEVGRTVRDRGVYVVKPGHQSWSSIGWTGEPLPEGFVYRSDLNERVLTVDEMRVIMGELWGSF
jgi:UDP-N-acetylglucosamine 4,6-dehydratase